jgi:hypothetical protein
MPFQPAQVSLEQARAPPSPLLSLTSGRSSAHRANTVLSARVTPPVISASAQSPFHRSGAKSGRAAATADEGSTQSSQLGASGSAKGRTKRSPAGVSLRLQSVAPTESPYSKHISLERRPSRCSHDLFPLRGVPTQPLGSRPPLMCLLRLVPRRLATLWAEVLRHFRVSIRLSLEAAPKTGSNLREVSYLFRSPATLQQSQANL